MDNTELQNYNDLKNEVYEHAQDDYFFFPFLIGSVRGHMVPFGEDMPIDEIKFWSLKVIKDLLMEDKIELISFEDNVMKVVKINSQSEIDEIVCKILTDWNKLGDREPDMGDLVWIQAKEDSAKQKSGSNFIP